MCIFSVLYLFSCLKQCALGQIRDVLHVCSEEHQAVWVSFRDISYSLLNIYLPYQLPLIELLVDNYLDFSHTYYSFWCQICISFFNIIYIAYALMSWQKWYCLMCTNLKRWRWVAIWYFPAITGTMLFSRKLIHSLFLGGIHIFESNYNKRFDVYTMEQLKKHEVHYYE